MTLNRSVSGSSLRSSRSSSGDERDEKDDPHARLSSREQFLMIVFHPKQFDFVSCKLSNCGSLITFEESMELSEKVELELQRPNWFDWFNKRMKESDYTNKDRIVVLNACSFDVKLCVETVKDRKLNLSLSRSDSIPNEKRILTPEEEYQIETYEGMVVELSLIVAGLKVATLDRTSPNKKYTIEQGILTDTYAIFAGMVAEKTAGKG